MQRWIGRSDHSATSAFSRPGAPSTMASSGFFKPRLARSSSSARQAASLSPPMFFTASRTFCPSRLMPRTTSSEIDVALRSSRTRTTVPSRMRRTIVFVGEITLVPGVPVGLDLAPHAADRVFADGAAEEGRQRTADTTRIATGEIATGDQSFDLLRAPSIGRQRLVLPLGRLAVGGVEPGARHGDRDRTEGAHQFALAIAMAVALGGHNAHPARCLLIAKPF